MTTPARTSLGKGGGSPCGRGVVNAAKSCDGLPVVIARPPERCRMTSAASRKSGGDKTVTVLAAASLTGTFTSLGKAFEAAHPGVKVTFTFGGSSTRRHTRVLQPFWATPPYNHRVASGAGSFGSGRQASMVTRPGRTRSNPAKKRRTSACSRK
ncbi:MAG: molybdenum transporter, periplasmic molybdate-binding protein [Actinomycetia bacterium]|nr:molybdenum transporter, periplasmic molybdate-binding protein [Actinomycetes bacterium]